MSQVATSDDETSTDDPTPEDDDLSNDPEDTVYIATAEHRVYHEDPDCYQLETSDADTPQEWGREEAEAWDYTQCKDCSRRHERTNGGPQVCSALHNKDSIDEALAELDDTGEIDAD